MRLAALLLFLATPATAQDVDCANAMSQSDMNACAYQDWEIQDADLNAAYVAAMDLLQLWDANLPEDEKGGVKALRDAQRAWITFRDKACEAEGYAMKGGSAEPLLVYGCMARLTEARAGQLWDMVAAYDM
jgi:uncharacterized protein YecT (DUF1311 family)